ncbi:MAG: metallophosphoesterase [Rhodobacteraceae bacterium]|nr:metallophosphoesterase [Paracoccaceae bacterium]
MKPRRFFAPVTCFSHPRVVRYQVSDTRWPLPDLKIAVVADLHCCRPWTPLSAIGRIVSMTNALGADMILLPGDFIADRNLAARPEPAAAIVAELARLSAPLGVAAVLGNHDWWDCPLSRRTGFQRNSVAEALAASSIQLLDNRSIAVSHRGAEFRLVGMDSQRALRKRGRPGLHRPDAAFADVGPDMPAILLAHEPDYFAERDSRAFLQISGHTHGGQANLFGWRPMVPSKFGARFGYGHIREDGRHLIVSGGIGYSGLPLRLFQPPEITLVTLRRSN